MASHLTVVAAVAALTSAGAVMTLAAPPEQPQPAARPATGPAAAGQRRMELAKRAAERGITVEDEELPYRWSRQLMEAEREAAGDAAGRRAAVEAHRARMAQQFDRIGSTTRPAREDIPLSRMAKYYLAAMSFEFYVAKAEHWLAKMDAEKQGK